MKQLWPGFPRPELFAAPLTKLLLYQQPAKIIFLVSDGEGDHFITGKQNRCALRNEDVRATGNRGDNAIVGEVDIVNCLIRDSRSDADPRIDHGKPSMPQRQEMREGAFGNRLLDQVHDVVGLADRDINPEHPKELLVFRIVDASDGSPDLKFFLRDLADDEIVLVFTGYRDHHVGAARAG